MRKLIITCLIAFLSLLPTITLAPNLSSQVRNLKRENINLLIKYNKVLVDNKVYYPFITVLDDTIICDNAYLEKMIHKTLLIRSIGMVEIGHDFYSYSKFNKDQRLKFAFNTKEGAVGITQMRKVMYIHITSDLKLGKYHIHDRWNATKSYEMFILFQNYYNPEWDLEKASRDWNGGGDLGMGKKTTLIYYNKVKYHYDKLKKEYNI